RAVTRTETSGKNALILADGQPLATVPMNDGGYFHLPVDPGALAAGDHVLAVEVVLADGVRLICEPRTLQYAKEGPWVSIDSFAPGDYVTGRPFLKGTAGWLAGETAAPAADASAGEGAEADAGVKKAAKDPKVPADRKVRLVEVSVDNGRSFSKAEGTDSWRLRLESQQLANGVLRLRAPNVTLMEPEEGGRFNESVPVMGTASDESGLKEVAVSLREGDKSRYQVPSFIQGLYVDAHTMGATYWDAGLGLTFFDSNVKLQVQIGMSPPGRFSGFVIGAKLLANIATLPFGYILGPSWDFFSMALAIGANFSYFTMSENSIAFSDAGLVLGGVVGQLEFAKFRIPGWRALNAWSLYTEYQLWFISSDVEGGVVNKLAFGMRVGLL
ncbi:MAG: hypothetical protein NT005_07190, partial [Spirochaetes bacterium]|nr:hypothetical protein [Spirochaetota bacterium]